MKNWLIEKYGGTARIVGDIVRNLIKKGKPISDNRKQKFSFFCTITGAIERLEILSRVTTLMEVNWRPVYYPEAHLAA